MLCSQQVLNFLEMGLPGEVKEITSKNLFKELVEHFQKETFRCLIPCPDRGFNDE